MYFKHLTPGDQVEVKLVPIKGVKTRQCEASVLQVYKRFVLVQLPQWKECVNLGAVLAGDEDIKLLEGEKNHAL